MTTPDDLEDGQEITLMKVDRVDAVKGPATALPFLLLKAADPDAQPGADELMAEASDAGADGAAGSEVPTDAPGDPDDPTSPAWEAVDAARARTAVNMVIALQRMVGTALSREAQEVVTTGDPEDDENAYDLSCVLDALDCVLETLAPFAVGEQAEALDREADAVLTKSGRVLSGTNEQRITSAMQSLQQVLASLPAATVPEGESMTKALETPVEETLTKSVETVDLPADEALEKAAGDPQQPVFDENGKLIGTVDPSKITALVGSEGPETPAEEAAEPPAEEAAEPAAPDAATIPGTDTVQAPVEQDMTKALDAETFKTSLAEVLAPFAKQLEDNAGLADMVKGLKEQVEILGRTPDDRKSPRLNGASGAPGAASRDGSETDQFSDLRKALDEALPADKQTAKAALAFAEIKGRFTR